MSDHALLAPSAADRWMRCPGSVPLTPADYHDQPSSPQAQWGTDAHEYLEQSLKSGLPPVSLANTNDPEAAEKADVANVAYEYAFNRQQELKPCAINAELKVRCGLNCQVPDCHGTSDIVLASTSTLEVADLKAGFGLVEPDTLQLRLYLLGALNEYWPDRSMPRPFTEFQATIIQPRVNHKDGLIRSVRYTLENLLEFEKSLAEIGQIIQGGAAPRIPGETQCKYCPAKEDCPEHESWVKQALTAPVAADSAGSGSWTLADLTSMGSVKSLDNSKLAQVKLMIPEVESWLDQINKEVHDRLSQGQVVPGWKLVENIGRPTWLIEGDKKVATRLRKLGLKEPQFYVKKIMTPLQVMKAPDVTEEQSSEIAKLWERPNKGFKVVSESDAGTDATSWMRTIK